jgi:integrase
MTTLTTLTAPQALVTPGTSANIARRLSALADRPRDLTVGTLIDRYMAVYDGRDTTRTQRLTTWRALIGDLLLDQLDSDVIYACRAELATQPALSFKGQDFAGNKVFKPRNTHRTKTAATLNRYVQAIAAVFTWSIEQRLTPRGWVHPCRGIRRLAEADGRVRFLDDDERRRLLDACQTSKYPRMHALVLTAMMTGARHGELLSLRWEDVDLTQGLAYLGRTKNGDRRTLVLLPQVVEALQPFASSDAKRYVFGSVRSGYQQPASIDTAWREALARAKVVDFRFHDLRHCCASYLAQAGTPLNVIAEVLGHRKLDMSRRYAHLTTQTKAQAMRQALAHLV